MMANSKDFVKILCRDIQVEADYIYIMLGLKISIVENSLELLLCNKTKHQVVKMLGI